MVSTHRRALRSADLLDCRHQVRADDRLAVDVGDQVVALETRLPGRLVLEGFNDAHGVEVHVPIDARSDALEATLQVLERKNSASSGDMNEVLGSSTWLNTPRIAA
jgi:hypothetical protein